MSGAIYHRMSTIIAFCVGLKPVATCVCNELACISRDYTGYVDIQAL